MKPRVLAFMSNNKIILYHDAKNIWNSLELLLLFFLTGLFWGYVLGRWTFFGSGSSLKDFFWV